jgi:ABC-type multidrug transport system fused ATPase/permease subunit
VSSTRVRQQGLVGLLAPYLKPQLGALLLALFLGFVLAMLGAAQPLLTRIVIDQGLIAHHFRRLIAACLGMLALPLIGLLLVVCIGLSTCARRGARYLPEEGMNYFSTPRREFR